MKILKKLRKHIVSSPKKLDDNYSLSKQISPLTFNSSVHGYNIKISSDGLLAKRNQSFCKAIVFSNRALLFGEEINIVITSISEAWSGSLRFGFTSVNPNNLKNKLPRYMCPDLTNVAGCYARALQDYETEIGTVLTFWLNKFGQIMYKINGQFQGVFLQIDQVNAKVPMWAMIDVYGIVTSIKIVNNENFALNKHKASSKSMSDINSINSIMTDLNINDNYFQQRRPQQQTISSLNCDTSPSRQIPVSRYYSNIEFNRMQLSETVGANIKLNSSRNIASRKNLTCSQGYVFTKRPLNINEKLVIQILKNDQLYSGNLGFGLTTCNPSKLTSNDLPEDSHKLLERSEYWVVIKDVLMNAKIGDELGFTINNLNQVLLTKNNLPPVVLMHIDPTQRFYAFFDLYGKTTKVHVLGTFFEANPMQLSNLINQNLSQNNMSNYYSEINNYNGSVQNNQQSKLKQINVKKCNSSYADKSENKSNTLIYKRSIIDQKKLSNNGECTVCFEKPINCVLYQCGHMCMCYDCALRQWQGVGSGQCPICRAYICDVIRTYWS